MVKVRLYGSLRAMTGKDTLILGVERLDGLLNTLKEKYAELAKLIDAEGFIVLVNEKPVPRDRLNITLSDEDCVDILPVVSGGV